MPQVGENQEETTNSSTKETALYYAVRKSDKLEGPAIFSRWQDCALYVDKEEDGGKVEYASFQSAEEAIAYAFGIKKKALELKSNNLTNNSTESSDSIINNAIAPSSNLVGETSSNEVKNTTINTMIHTIGQPPTIPTPTIPTTTIPTTTIPASTIPAPTIPILAIPASTIPVPTIPIFTIPTPTMYPPTMHPPTIIHPTILSPTISPIFVNPMGSPLASALINPKSAPLAPIIIPPKPTGTDVLDSKVLLAAETVIQKRTAEEEASMSTLIEQPAKKQKTESLSKQYKSLYTWLKDDRAKIKSLQEQENRSTVESETTKQVERVLDLGLEAVRNPRSVGKRVVKWQRSFEMLIKYKEKYGSCDTQISIENMTEEEKNERSRLKSWVRSTTDQLTLFEKDPKASTLDPDRVKQLIDIGFVKHVRQDGNKLPPRGGKSWDENFNDLQAFKEENGHTNVPHLPKSSLRNWVVLQRDMYVRLKEGRKSDLNGERVTKLLELEFMLQPSSRLTFDERAAEWLEFKTKHDREPLRKKEDTSEKEESLGAWVTKMRGKYSLLQEGEKTNLTHEQVDKLTAWGFKWETGFKKPTMIGPRKTWEERFAELCAYKNENGHVNVPQLYPQLGNWVHRQRKDHRARKLGYRNGLNDEKLAKLKDVGFIFLTRKSPRSSKDEPIKTEAGVESEDYTASEEDADIDTDHNGYNDSEHPDQSHEVLQKSYEQDPKIPYASRRQPGIFCN